MAVEGLAFQSGRPQQPCPGPTLDLEHRCSLAWSFPLPQAAQEAMAAALLVQGTLTRCAEGSCEREELAEVGRVRLGGLDLPLCDSQRRLNLPQCCALNSDSEG